MQKLTTIQKREKLNDIYNVENENNPSYRYIICDTDTIINNENPNYIVETLGIIDFQNGPRNTEGSTRGIIDTDLLEIVKHRLESFQAGPYSCRENAIALTHIEEALMWMNRRVEDRIERRVLGKMEK